MPLGWEGIVGSVGIIGVLAAPGVMIDRWVSSGSGPRLAAASAPRRVAVVDSLSGSEALSYDSAHDVYLVSNINGTPQVKDGNGFISRIGSDGKMDSLHFIQGGRDGVVLNGPMGSRIRGDTLWVVDIDARRHARAEAAHWSHAPHGRRSTHPSSAGGGCSVHLFTEPLRGRLRAAAGREEVPTMRLNHGMFALMLSATALASASAMTGCAGGGLYYDSYGHDYHRWNRGEDRLYRQWEVQGHRSHMDFQRRSAGDQSAYWGWRHR